VSAKVLCFASAKGGAGKTMITASVGAFLKALGKRVVLVDADAATNGLTLLYIKEVLSRQGETDEGRFPEGLFEGNDLTDATALHLPSGVDLIPATYHFVNTEAYRQEDFVARLSRELGNLRSEYDYVLLDAQAGSDFCASVAMRKSISDLVVLVAEYDPMSAAGIERLKGLLRDDLTYSRTWILLNKILPEFAKNFSDFLEIARYLNPIPWDADVVRAYARRRLALDTENGNAFTIALMQTVRTLLGDDIEKDVKLWTENRAEAIRLPIKAQYNDLENELGFILEESAKAEAQQRRLDRWSFMGNIGIAAASAGIGLVFISDKGAANANLVALVTGAVSIAAIGLAIHKLFVVRLAPKTADKLDLAKLNRRRQVIEDQLKKLETLRAADPEALLRARRET